MAGLRARKKPRKLPRYMTEEEVERLILATPDLRYRAAIVTAYGAGLRISETVAIKTGDIKSDKKLLHIPSGKGGTERMAPLPHGVIDYLRGYWKNMWPQPAIWLFYGASPDVPIRTGTLNQAFKKARDKAGIDSRFSFHCLRHSTATHLHERGANMEVIRDALGHRRADTTRRVRPRHRQNVRGPRPSSLGFRCFAADVAWSANALACRRSSATPAALTASAWPAGSMSGGSRS